MALLCCTWGIEPANMGIQKQPFYEDILMGMIYLYTIYIYLYYTYIVGEPLKTCLVSCFGRLLQ